MLLSIQPGHDDGNISLIPLTSTTESRTSVMPCNFVYRWNILSNNRLRYCCGGIEFCDTRHLSMFGKSERSLPFLELDNFRVPILACVPAFLNFLEALSFVNTYLTHALQDFARCVLYCDIFCISHNSFLLF